MRGRAMVLSLALLSMGGRGECAMQTVQAVEGCVHLSASFQFEVKASFARTAVLFGPESEKGWAGERWQPKFLYPEPGADVKGAVFTVQHGPHTSVWVNTVYDVAGGKMQYVAIIPGVVATTVDVRLTGEGENKTRVEVSYVRTALDAAANDDVREMSQHDAGSGPEWQEAIEKLLVK